MNSSKIKTLMNEISKNIEAANQQSKTPLKHSIILAGDTATTEEISFLILIADPDADRKLVMSAMRTAAAANGARMITRGTAEDAPASWDGKSLSIMTKMYYAMKFHFPTDQFN